MEAIEDSRKNPRAGPSTPRERRIALKKALILAFIVVSLLFVFIMNLPPSPRSSPEPTLQFEQPVRIVGGWKIVVGEVSVLKSRGQYEVVLSRNGTVVVENIWMPGPFLYFYDLDDDGNLSAGDCFIAVCDPGSEYELEIIWRGPRISIGHVEWET